MGGLKAVQLRDGPGDDDAHGVGHEVGLQGFGDGLLLDRGTQAHDVGVVDPGGALLRGFLLWHNNSSLSRFLYDDL